MNTSIRLLVGLTVLLSLPGNSPAADFCTQGFSELRVALQTAATNGTGDIIRVTQVPIVVPPGQYLAYVAEDELPSETLQILGGYTTGCMQRSPGSKSQVDASATTGPIVFYAYVTEATFLMKDMVFSGYGLSSATGSTAVVIEGYGATVRVDENGFFDNHGTTASAVDIAVEGHIVFTDNIVAKNSSTEQHVARVSLGETCVVRNNTVVHNAASAGSTHAGLHIKNCQEANVASNVLWNNDGADLMPDGGAATRIAHNDLETLALLNGAQVMETANIAVEPGFVAGTYQLAKDSPLLDQGDPALDPDNPVDYFDGPRALGSAIDIGASEGTSEIFRNGFE